MPEFRSASDFIQLDLEHWCLVGMRGTGELRVVLWQSLWQTARSGAEIKPLQRAMGETIDAMVAQTRLVPFDESGLTMLSIPADEMVRQWRAKWCVDVVGFLDRVVEKGMAGTNIPRSILLGTVPGGLNRDEGKS